MTADDVQRVLTTPRAGDLLRTSLLMRLGYDGPDGYPRVIPIGFTWDGRGFIVCTAERAPKVAALRANDRVALTIDTQTQPPKILLVRGRASVEIVEGIPPEFLDASRKYVPRDQWDDFDTQVRGLYPRMARIRITPQWAKLIDFETTFPSAVAELWAQRSG